MPSTACCTQCTLLYLSTQMYTHSHTQTKNASKKKFCQMELLKCPYQNCSTLCFMDDRVRVDMERDPQIAPRDTHIVIFMACAIPTLSLQHTEYRSDGVACLRIDSNRFSFRLVHPLLLAPFDGRRPSCFLFELPCEKAHMARKVASSQQPSRN